MSKAAKIARMIKLTLYCLGYVLKLLLKLAAHMLNIIGKDISKRLRFSITFKTASVYTLIFSVILVILSGIIMFSFGAFMLYQSKASLDKGARVTLDFLNENQDIPSGVLKKYADVEGFTITVFNRQKSVTFTTRSARGDVVFYPGGRYIDGLSITSGQQINYNIKPALNDRLYYIQLSKPLAAERFYLTALFIALAVCFVFTVLLTVFLGSRASKKMLEPIGDMIGTARTISAGAFETRLNVVDSHDELKELAETFNEMLDRIQHSYEQQNQFVSDASHELRTPISVIQGYANLLQRWGKEDKDVLEESLSAIKNESDNMKALVEKLLFLARTDKHKQNIEKGPFSLNELIDEVVKETRLIDSQHNILCEINEAVVIDADRGLIKQGVRIFVDNSIKYTPAGGTIRINCRLMDNQAIIEIQDSGIGIAKEDLPHIFNRFYKCDKSRTRENGGAGLGLSIAKWIIEKHQGKINVASVPAVGTKVSISLPV